MLSLMGQNVNTRVLNVLTSTCPSRVNKEEEVEEDKEDEDDEEEAVLCVALELCCLVAPPLCANPSTATRLADRVCCARRRW